MRSVLEEEFGKICVGSQINWLKPYEEVIASTWLPSLVVRSFFHQEGLER